MDSPKWAISGNGTRPGWGPGEVDWASLGFSKSADKPWQTTGKTWENLGKSMGLAAKYSNYDEGWWIFALQKRHWWGPPMKLSGMGSPCKATHRPWSPTNPHRLENGFTYDRKIRDTPPGPSHSQKLEDDEQLLGWKVAFELFISYTHPKSQEHVCLI